MTSVPASVPPKPSVPVVVDLDDSPAILPSMHYIFIEKTGNIPKCAGECWTSLHSILSEIKKTNDVTGYMSLYSVKKSTYRAGVSLSKAPENPLPSGVSYEYVVCGTYRKFILKGSYMQLGEACGIVEKTMGEKGILERDSWRIEHYINDPKTTAVDDLITHILIPTENNDKKE